jgi:hypothetical protein
VPSPALWVLNEFGTAGLAIGWCAEERALRRPVCEADATVANQS